MARNSPLKQVPSLSDAQHILHDDANNDEPRLSAGMSLLPTLYAAAPRLSWANCQLRKNGAVLVTEPQHQLLSTLGR